MSSFKKFIICNPIFLLERGEERYIMKTDDEVVAEREANALRKFPNHANIVQLIALLDGPTGQSKRPTKQIVVEFCEGGAVDEMAGTVRWEERHIAAIVRSVLVALRDIHKQDLVHLDLKGANVFITRDGGLKLGDFGVCHAQFEKVYYGTRMYYSPELLRNRRLWQEYNSSLRCAPITTASDAFSVGAFVIELLFCSSSEFCTAAVSPAELVDECRRKGMAVIAGFQAHEFYGPKIRAASPTCLGFLEACLRYEPERRLTVKQLLKHPWMTGNADKGKRGVTLAGQFMAATSPLFVHTTKTDLEKLRTNARKAGIVLPNDTKATLQGGGGQPGASIPTDQVPRVALAEHTAHLPVLNYDQLLGFHRDTTEKADAHSDVASNSAPYGTKWRDVEKFLSDTSPSETQSSDGSTASWKENWLRQWDLPTNDSDTSEHDQSRESRATSDSPSNRRRPPLEEERSQPIVSEERRSGRPITGLSQPQDGQKSRRRPDAGSPESARKDDTSMRYCGHCGIQFSAKRLRNAHEREGCPRKANDEIRCGFCGLVFHGKQKRICMDSRVKHESSRCQNKANIVPAECPKCDAIYNKRRNLEIHAEEEH
ncbi:serine-threonine kinase SepH [Aphelenchoides avenae]|nr:serine-threonine kinase SepH [Aphelenchus avenae]